MKIIINKPHWQVITLGILAGMRAMSAPAISSRILSGRHSKRLAHSPLNFMQSGTTANVLSVMAIGESVGDKMPEASDRISAGALIGRSISGGVSGASIYRASGKSAIKGALLGSIIAIASTYASFYLRKSIVKQAHLIDPIVGTIEDAVVLGTGLGLSETA